MLDAAVLPPGVMEVGVGALPGKGFFSGDPEHQSR
jgi:hypothetical protein